MELGWSDCAELTPISVRDERTMMRDKQAGGQYVP